MHVVGGDYAAPQQLTETGFTESIQQDSFEPGGIIGRGIHDLPDSEPMMAFGLIENLVTEFCIKISGLLRPVTRSLFTCIWRQVKTTQDAAGTRAYKKVESVRPDCR